MFAWSREAELVNVCEVGLAPVIEQARNVKNVSTSFSIWEKMNCVADSMSLTSCIAFNLYLATTTSS